MLQIFHLSNRFQNIGNGGEENRRKAKKGSEKASKASGFIYAVSKVEEEEAEDIPFGLTYTITSLAHFEKTGAVEDQHHNIPGLEEAGFSKMMESCFESQNDEYTSRKKLEALGIQFNQELQNFLDDIEE